MSSRYSNTQIINNSSKETCLEFTVNKLKVPEGRVLCCVDNGSPLCQLHVSCDCHQGCSYLYASFAYQWYILITHYYHSQTAIIKLNCKICVWGWLICRVFFILVIIFIVVYHKLNKHLAYKNKSYYFLSLCTLNGSFFTFLIVVGYIIFFFF